MTTIALSPVSGSSLIAADGWDDQQTVLAVQFHGTGKTYEYRGLDPATHDAYEAAESKGKYLKRFIEPNVRGTQV